jgi:hypothetical protein
MLFGTFIQHCLENTQLIKIVRKYRKFYMKNFNIFILLTFNKKPIESKVTGNLGFSSTAAVKGKGKVYPRTDHEGPEGE